MVAAFWLAAGSGQAAAASEGPRCYPTWSEAAPVVKRESLVSVDQLNDLARAHGSGDVLKVTLCEDNGRFVYRLIVRVRPGHLRNMWVDARRPFEP